MIRKDLREFLNRLIVQVEKHPLYSHIDDRIYDTIWHGLGEDPRGHARDYLWEQIRDSNYKK